MTRTLTLPPELQVLMSRLFVEERGSARQVRWLCEDGWWVHYTSERIRGGPHDGRFAAMLYRPLGPGARSGKAQAFRLTYLRAYSTRKAAKARALALYAQHSPRYRARMEG